MAEKEKIELRSEKIRNIIGNVPSNIIRNGTSVIIIILIGLVFAAFYIPYPESIKAKVTITTLNDEKYYAVAYIPYHFVTVIKKNMSVEVEFDGYSYRMYGFQKGIIHDIENKIVVIDGANYICAILLFDKTDKTFFIQENMNGIASILVSNKNIIKYFIEK